MRCWSAPSLCEPSDGVWTGGADLVCRPSFFACGVDLQVCAGPPGPALFLRFARNLSHEMVCRPNLTCAGMPACRSKPRCRFPGKTRAARCRACGRSEEHTSE